MSMKDALNSAIYGARRSAIREYSRLAAETPGCVALTLGEPDFDTPQPVEAAVDEAFAHHETHYIPNNGSPALREAIADYEDILANDEHVIEMSGVNIREVEADDLPYRPAMIVSDVSFISLTYVIPVIARIAAPGAQIVLLVKPQFEVGRAGLGKNGIVEDPALRERALHDVVACAEQHGLDVVATADSPIIGTHGNEEYLLYAVLR